MASSGAARSCVQRALQACQRGSLTAPSSTRALPLAPLLARHVQQPQQQQSRHFVSSSSFPPSDNNDGNNNNNNSNNSITNPTSLAVSRSPRSVAVPGSEAAEEVANNNTTKPKRRGPVKRLRPNRDHSKQRGLSAMRRTGPRDPLSVSDLPLPRPVEETRFPRVQTDPDHGLWQFFYARDRPLNTPKQDREHGRAWRVEELRRKSWSDLHALWWVCVKERNRIMTGNMERKKGTYGYGDVESKEREMEVRKTQNAIKHALTERFYAWEDALKLAEKDPEIVINENGVRYKRGGQPGWENEPEVDEDSIWADDEPVAGELEAGKPSMEPLTQQDQPKAQLEAPRM